MRIIHSLYARLMFIALLVVALPLTLVAAEGADAAVPAAAPEGAPWWVNLLYPILMAVALPWLRAYLKKKAEHEAAEAEGATLSANATLQEQRNFFIDKRLIPFLWNEAEHAVDTRLPEILKDATDGGGFDWKLHLRNLKADLFAAATEKFEAEGMDLLAMVGRPTLDRLIDRAFAKATPWLPSFLNNDMAKEKAGDLAVLGINKGFGYVREEWLDGGIDKLLGEASPSEKKAEG